MRTESRLLPGIAALALCSALLVAPGAGAEIREGSTSSLIVVTNNGVRELPPEEDTVLRVFVHDERPTHRNRQPVCEPTKDDGDETFGATGWRLPAGGLEYRVNESRAPAGIRGQVEAVLDRAVDAWRGADGDIQLARVGTTTIARPRYDGQNTVLWRSLSKRTVAVAYVWFDPETGEALDADMVFNTRVPWAVNDPASGDCGGVLGAYDLQAVAVHEIGHWVGLDDLYDPSDTDLTMYGLVTLGELKKDTLGKGDTLGAQAVAP